MNALNEMMDKWGLVVFLLCPVAMVLTAFLNQVISKTIAGSPLILYYLAGVVSGLFFYFGTAPDANAFLKICLGLSHGAFGWLHWAGVEGLQDRGPLFLISVGGGAAAVLLSAALSWATVALGKEQNGGGLALSLILQMWLILPFAIVTNLLFFLVFFVFSGFWVALAKDKTRVGMNGGVLYVEWDKNNGSTFATTFGWVVSVWEGKMSGVLEHEMFHVRQYMILRDLFGLYYVLAGLLGFINVAASSCTFEGKFFYAAHHDKESGNWLEIAPYRKDGASPFNC